MSAISEKMKILDRQIKKTNVINTDLRSALNNIQYRLSMIPWWKYVVVFLFYWLVKAYLHTGWTSIAGFAVSVAVSTNLIMVLPRISDNTQERVIPIAKDHKNMISETVVILNHETQKNKTIIKKHPEIDLAYKPINIELITGDVYKGKLISETAQMFVILITLNGKQTSKKIDKELVQRAW